MSESHANSKTVEAIPSTTQSTNAAIIGAIIDRAGYKSVEFVIHASTLTTAAAAFAVTMEHGNAANLSDTAPVATLADGLVGTLAAAAFTGNDDNKTFRVGYAGSKRYVRLTITPSSNAAAATVEALAMLLGPAFGSGPQSSMP